MLWLGVISDMTPSDECGVGVCGGCGCAHGAHTACATCLFDVRGAGMGGDMDDCRCWSGGALAISLYEMRVSIDLDGSVWGATGGAGGDRDESDNDGDGDCDCHGDDDEAGSGARRVPHRSTRGVRRD